MEFHSRLMVVTSQMKEVAEKEITQEVLAVLQQLLNEATTLLLSLASLPHPD